MTEKDWLHGVFTTVPYDPVFVLLNVRLRYKQICCIFATAADK